MVMLLDVVLMTTEVLLLYLCYRRWQSIMANRPGTPTIHIHFPWKNPVNGPKPGEWPEGWPVGLGTAFTIPNIPAPYPETLRPDLAVKNGDLTFTPAIEASLDLTDPLNYCYVTVDYWQVTNSQVSDPPSVTVPTLSIRGSPDCWGNIVYANSYEAAVPFQARFSIQH